MYELLSKPSQILARYQINRVIKWPWWDTTSQWDCLVSVKAARAKLTMQSTVHKVRGEAKVSRYPQPEGLLGETMHKGGQDLGDDSLFGKKIITVH